MRRQRTHLYWAAHYGRGPVAASLLSHGADPNCAFAPESGHREFPLTVAAYNGHLEVIDLLVEHGADLNQRDSQYGYTALHWTVHGGKLDAAQYLVDYGCNVEAEDSEGNTALFYAVNNNHIELVHFLTSDANGVGIIPDVEEPQVFKHMFAATRDPRDRCCVQ
jgi:ankyrin repeat protein